MTSKNRATDVATRAGHRETPLPRQAEPTEAVTRMSERHLYKVPEAMRLLSMSRSVIYEQMRAGRLKFVKQGRSTLIPALAIQEYIQTLLNESEVSR